MATSTSVSSALTDVPEILKPYITDKGGVLPTAQAITGQSYDQMYGNALNKAGLAGAGRVASLSPMQQDVGAALQNMKAPEQFGQGTTAVNQGLSALQQASNAYGGVDNVNNLSLNQYQMAGPQNVNAKGLTQYQMQGPDQYTGNQVSQYMSPYMQQVVDVQKQAALRDAQKQLVGANLASSRQGTYGGARNALMQSEADRNLQTQMGTIQATGTQNAFQNAQQQFNANQQMQQAANQANLQAQLGVQQLGSGQDLQAQLANQAANQSTNQANLQALLGVQQLGSAQSLESQKANQAAALAKAQGFGQLGQTYNQAGSTLGALGTAQQATNMDIVKAQGAYGDLQRNIQQNQLDAQYNDLMTKLNQPLTNVETMNNLARGVPLTQTGGIQTTTTPPPSFASQLAGMGLTGLSLYNMFPTK
jgi:hypothetical protein